MVKKWKKWKFRTWCHEKNEKKEKKEEKYWKTLSTNLCTNSTPKVFLEQYLQKWQNADNTKNCHHYLHKNCRNVWLLELYVKLHGETLHCTVSMNPVIYIFLISIISIHFTNQITLNQSLTQRLKLIFKFISIKRQISIPVWAHLWDKGWRREDGKTFIRCYTTA